MYVLSLAFNRSSNFKTMKCFNTHYTVFITGQPNTYMYHLQLVQTVVLCSYMRKKDNEIKTV